MAMAGPVLSMTPGSPNVSSVSARALAKSARGLSLKTSGGVPPGGATSSPRAAPTKYRWVWSMWFMSVRTSHPSQVVGSSSCDAAPTTLVEVQSLARPYRSSRSGSMTPPLGLPQPFHADTYPSVEVACRAARPRRWARPHNGPDLEGAWMAIRAVMFDFGGVI